MIQYRLGGSSTALRGWPAVVLIGVGIVFLVSGLALLVVLGAAAAVVGAGVLAYRRLTGRSTMPPVTRRTDPLELEPDFVILPSKPDAGAPTAELLPRPADRTDQPLS